MKEALELLLGKQVDVNGGELSGVITKGGGETYLIAHHIIVPEQIRNITFYAGPQLPNLTIISIREVRQGYINE
jgi:hypothetical protein